MVSAEGPVTERHFFELSETEFFQLSNGEYIFQGWTIDSELQNAVKPLNNKGHVGTDIESQILRLSSIGEKSIAFSERCPHF